MKYGMRFMTLYRRQGSRPSPWNRMQKSKMAVWGDLTNIVKRREVNSQGEKERYKHLNAEFQRIARRDKKAFSSDPRGSLGAILKIKKLRVLEVR